jgi:hypothetical protein
MDWIRHKQSNTWKKVGGFSKANFSVKLMRIIVVVFGGFAAKNYNRHFIPKLRLLYYCLLIKIESPNKV